MCKIKQNPHDIPLFMYFRLEGAKSFLETHALKMADPTRCNDPYESCYKLIFNGQLCQDNDDFRKMIDKQLKGYGISCFSTLDNSILMWAYYAESQKGICFEFQPESDPIAFTNLQYISYSSDLFAINERWHQFYIQKILTTKAKDWEHENEVRLIKEGLAGKFLTLNPQSIRSIIFGCNLQRFYDTPDDLRRKNALEQILELLKRPEYLHIVIKQITQDDKTYKLMPHVCHSILWQENDKVIITSLANQRLCIKRIQPSFETICYTAQMNKWERVSLQLNSGMYYIESDSIDNYLRFEVKEYQP